ncbi:hypothetical protein ACI2LC_03830 [Nonomuraea wenchangensis]
MRIVLAVVAALIAIPLLIGGVGGLESTDGGQVAVVRDGGPW